MEKNDIIFKIIEGIPSSKNLKHLDNLYTNIFEDAQIDFFRNRINEKEGLCTIIAFKNEKPIAFKIGYNYNKTTFYSWVGGVLPEFRKKEIGKNLAQLQEQWARKNSYSKLRTKSMNRFKSMMILN